MSDERPQQWSGAPLPGTRVVHTDTDGYTTTGTVCAPRRRKAWTPNDYAATAPDRDMVIVQWDNDTDLHWEYTHTLDPLTPTSTSTHTESAAPMEVS